MIQPYNCECATTAWFDTAIDPQLIVGMLLTDSTGRTWAVSSVEECHLDFVVMANPPPPAQHHWRIQLRLRDREDTSSLTFSKKVKLAPSLSLSLSRDDWVCEYALCTDVAVKDIYLRYIQMRWPELDVGRRVSLLLGPLANRSAHVELPAGRDVSAEMAGWAATHAETAWPEITKLDRQTLESEARAPTIAVTNSTKIP